MLRVLFWASVTVCGVIGVVHTAFTFVAFDHLSQRALYFAGTGLAALVLALFNAAVWHASGSDRLARRLALVANALMAIFGAVAVRAVPEPQAYVGLAAIVGLLGTTLRLDGRSRPLDGRRAPAA